VRQLFIVPVGMDFRGLFLLPTSCEDDMPQSSHRRRDDHQLFAGVDRFVWQVRAAALPDVFEIDSRQDTMFRASNQLSERVVWSFCLSSRARRGVED